MPDLIEAAHDALAYIEADRQNLLESACTVLRAADGTPITTLTGELARDRQSADEQSNELLLEVEALIARLKAAIEDPYPTRIILDLCAAHLDPETTQLLDEWAAMEEAAVTAYRLAGSGAFLQGAKLPPHRTHRHIDGWVVVVPSEDEDDLMIEIEPPAPRALEACFSVARRHSARFINFDRDAEPYPLLRLYEPEATT
jgi:hypothetical protein